MTQTASEPGLVTHPAEREFVISRTFDAPRDLVFRAWTEPQHLSRWWGPRIMTTSACELDARPGGAYRITMRSPEGEEYPMKGVFREIVRPERLVMTMDCSEHPPAWHDLIKPNRAKDDVNPAGEMLCTVTFEDLNGKTKVTVRMLLSSAEVRTNMVKMGMNEGWSQSFDRLEELLAQKL